MIPMTEVERDFRNKAFAEYQKRRKPSVVDQRLAQPFMHMTRWKHSKIVDRERMRFEAEQKRGNKKRAAEAKTAWLGAKTALEARDRFYGRP